MKTYTIHSAFKTKYSLAPIGVTLQCGRYPHDRTQKYIMILDRENQEPLATASVMLEGEQQSNDEIFIKNWSENEGILTELILHKIVARPHGTLPAGYTIANVCRILIPLELFD